MEAGAPVVVRPEQEHKIDFNQVFSLRKPKDAAAGLSSGLKSIAKGVVGGGLGMMIAPAIGAYEEGLLGFATGLLKGALGLVVLPVTGLAVGAIQIVRGVVNSPEAVVRYLQGRVWDQERREWIRAPDGTVVTAADAERVRSGLAMLRKADGIDYYELLQVPRSATTDEIRKQYYKQARLWHPDKNPDNREAHVRFQQLGEAYQVLANEELRAQYDHYGAVDVNFMDSGEFFTMLFGGDQFEHLVGELMITTAAKSGGGLPTGALVADVQQAQRVATLAQLLIARLQPYVDGEFEAFTATMTAEAERLASESFGETMLHVIGRVYELVAGCHLGNFFTHISANVALGAETLRTQIAAAGAAVQVYKAQQKVVQWHKRWDARVAKAAAIADKEAKKAAEAQIKAHQAARAASMAAAKAATKAGRTASTGAGGTSTSGGGTATGGAGGTGATGARTSLDAVPEESLTSGAASAESASPLAKKGVPDSSQPSPSPTATAAAAGAAAGGTASTPPSPHPPSWNTPPSGSPTASPPAADDGGPPPDTTPSQGDPPVLTEEELAEKQRLEDAALPLMLDAMWAANVMDITSTLRLVAHRVLDDPHLPAVARDVRAMALKECGKIFQMASMARRMSDAGEASRAAGGKADAGAVAKQRMEDAMMKVLDKRFREDAPHEDEFDGPN